MPNRALNDLRLVVFLDFRRDFDDLPPPIEPFGRNVVTTVGFAGAGFFGKGWRFQPIVRTTHATLRGRFSVLLNSHALTLSLDNVLISSRAFAPNQPALQMADVDLLVRFPQRYLLPRRALNPVTWAPEAAPRATPLQPVPPS